MNWETQFDIAVNRTDIDANVKTICTYKCIPILLHVFGRKQKAVIRMCTFSYLQV